MSETVLKIKIFKYNFLVQKLKEYQILCNSHCDISYRQKDYIALVKMETNSYIKWFLLIFKIKLNLTYKKS